MCTCEQAMTSDMTLIGWYRQRVMCGIVFGWLAVVTTNDAIVMTVPVASSLSQHPADIGN